MKIEIITTYWHEQFLAPLFMLHYEPWSDKITLLTSRFPGDKFDDSIKTDLTNQAIARSDADWVIVVDFDEFVFPMLIGTDPRVVLENEQADILNCEMVRVWRHATDQDIDRMQPPLIQRRHGELDHVKPCIFRPRGIKLDIGAHGVTTPPGAKWGTPWKAAHWANADPCFGIERSLVDRQLRLSQNQIDHGWGIVKEWLDPKFLPDKYVNHMNDPLIIL